MRSHVRKNNTQEVTCGGNALKFYAAMRLRTATSCLLQTNSQEVFAYFKDFLCVLVLNFHSDWMCFGCECRPLESESRLK